MIQKCDWRTDQKKPLFDWKDTTKQTPFCIDIPNKKLYAHPPSSHPQLIMNLNAMIGH